MRIELFHIVLGIFIFTTSCASDTSSSGYVKPEDLGFPTEKEICSFLPERMGNLVTDFDEELKKELAEEGHPGVIFNDAEGKWLYDDGFGNFEELKKSAVGWQKMIFYEAPDGSGAGVFYGFSKGRIKDMMGWWEWELVTDNENVTIYKWQRSDEKAARLAVVGGEVFILVSTRHVSVIASFDDNFFPEIDWDGLYQLSKKYGK